MSSHGVGFSWDLGLVRNLTMAIPFLSLVEFTIMLVNKDKPGGTLKIPAIA